MSRRVLIFWMIIFRSTLPVQDKFNVVTSFAPLEEYSPSWIDKDFCHVPFSIHSLKECSPPLDIHHCCSWSITRARCDWSAPVPLCPYLCQILWSKATWRDLLRWIDFSVLAIQHPSYLYAARIYRPWGLTHLWFFGPSGGLARCSGHPLSQKSNGQNWGCLSLSKKSHRHNPR